MTYLLKRGKGSLRRKAHLTMHDPMTGQPTMQPICGRVNLAFDMTSNVPWGRPLCKECRAKVERANGNG